MPPTELVPEVEYSSRLFEELDIVIAPLDMTATAQSAPLEEESATITVSVSLTWTWTW